MQMKYLGRTKGTFPQNIYLRDFEWACGWYWSGGWIKGGLHCHFDGCFLEVPDGRGHPLGSFGTPWDKNKENTVMSNGCAVWEPLSFFLDDAQFDENTWWRIKDLFRQFYTLSKAAEVFQYGGHCSATGRTEAEINPAMAGGINAHIETVIIPEIRKIMRFTGKMTKYGVDNP